MNRTLCPGIQLSSLVSRNVSWNITSPAHITSFVLIYGLANVGDTSPNTLGPVCQSPGERYDGQPCDFETSACGGRTQDCIGRFVFTFVICADLWCQIKFFWGRGPGFRVSDFESNRIIAQVQFDGARTLMSRPLTPLNGPVKYVHTYLNMYVPLTIQPAFANGGWEESSR